MSYSYLSIIFCSQKFKTAEHFPLFVFPFTCNVYLSKLVSTWMFPRISLLVIWPLRIILLCMVKISIRLKEPYEGHGHWKPKLHWSTWNIEWQLDSDDELPSATKYLIDLTIIVSNFYDQIWKLTRTYRGRKGQRSSDQSDEVICSVFCELR